MLAGVNIGGMARSRTRTRYHHGDLRNALLRAAARLAEREGPAAVTIRSAARAVGVTPTAAYRHFAGQQELLSAVKDEAFTSLGQAMLHYLERLPESGDPVLDAVRRAVAMGRGYVRFAVAEPGMFRTAFVRPASPPPEKAQRPGDPFGLLARGLDELVKVGYLAPESRPMAEFAAWAAVHGLAVMLIDGELADLPEEARALAVHRTLLMLVHGLADGEHAEPVRSSIGIDTPLGVD
jgi:AcrR family transcriptional regulator